MGWQLIWASQSVSAWRPAASWRCSSARAACDVSARWRVRRAWQRSDLRLGSCRFSPCIIFTQMHSLAWSSTCSYCSSFIFHLSFLPSSFFLSFLLSFPTSCFSSHLTARRCVFVYVKDGFQVFRKDRFSMEVMKSVVLAYFQVKRVFSFSWMFFYFCHVLWSEYSQHSADV